MPLRGLLLALLGASVVLPAQGLLSGLGSRKASAELLSLVDNELRGARRGSAGSLQDKKRVDELVEGLVADAGPVSVARARKLLPGRWQLLYTSRPNQGLENLEWFQYLAANGPSPIQRLVVGATAQVTLVYQELDEDLTMFSNVIDFEDTIGGKLFLNAEIEAVAEEGQVNIRFANAFFEFTKNALSKAPLGRPLKLPYPVPFRLLPNESRGELNTLYVDDSLRISRGNRGTTFVLRRMA